MCPSFFPKSTHAVLLLVLNSICVEVLHKMQTPSKIWFQINNKYVLAYLQYCMRRTYTEKVSVVCLIWHIVYSFVWNPLLCRVLGKTKNSSPLKTSSKWTLYGQSSLISEIVVPWVLLRSPLLQCYTVLSGMASVLGSPGTTGEGGSVLSFTQLFLDTFIHSFTSMHSAPSLCPAHAGCRVI